MSDTTVLVTGATGMQGDAVARALRRANIRTTALLRDVETPAARADDIPNLGHADHCPRTTGSLIGTAQLVRREVFGTFLRPVRHEP